MIRKTKHDKIKPASTSVIFNLQILYKMYIKYIKCSINPYTYGFIKGLYVEPLTMHSQVYHVWHGGIYRIGMLRASSLKRHKKVIPLTKSSNMRTATDIRLEFVE